MSKLAQVHEFRRMEKSEQIVSLPTLDIGIERFKQGKCPCCGKSKGAPKGLEYRSKPNDLFCHTCKRRWPIELNLDDLRSELSLAIASESDARQSEVVDLVPQRRTAEIEAESRGLRRLLKRIVLRR